MSKISIAPVSPDSVPLSDSDPPNSTGNKNGDPRGLIESTRDRSEKLKAKKGNHYCSFVVVRDLGRLQTTKDL